MFLSVDEVAFLTGCKLKSRQIAALRTMGIPFFVNAAGRPVVTRVAVEGKQTVDSVPVSRWSPGVLAGHGA